MKAIIKKSTASGSITVPSSKSIAHRVLICAAFSDGVTEITNVNFNDDIKATVSCLKSMGIEIEERDNSVITVYGNSHRGKIIFNRQMDCNESGSTLRFMLPFALLDGIKTTFYGSEKLFSRPLEVYEAICKENGIIWEKTANSLTVCGKIKSRRFEVPGDISSQFISGLAMALTQTENDSVIEITTSLESASYVYLTLDALETFGFSVKFDNNKTLFIKGGINGKSPKVYAVPGDESGAAFFGALNSLGGKAELCGLQENSTQGDAVWKEHIKTLTEQYASFSLADCPDLAPILMVVAALNHGAHFTDTSRLKLKESDRGNAMAEELKKCGINITVNENDIIVPKSSVFSPVEEFSSHNDHRIAMSLAVLATVTGGVINGAECVKKSMPEFWQLLKSLNIDFEITA
ncbi:MAG: 3-phosphoshikimate 1-carboxyvinyltransferase [Clostridiales bacterium]|nr:3-phosphoshikimate 1-carboxyvinyltransferase [Clostridiales bacterium]